MKKLLLLCLLCVTTAQAQDLLSMLGEAPTNTFTKATFKGSRIVNAQSNEQVAAGALKFMVQHRFGTLNSGAYNLWGLDNSKIRLGLEYGLHERFAIGLGRSSSMKEFDFSAKGKVLRQSEKMPLSLSVYSAMFFKHPSSNARAQSDFEVLNQLSFANQLILSKKVNSQLSVALLPVYVRVNKLDNDLQLHDMFFGGIGGRYKLTKRLSLNFEYFTVLNEMPTLITYGEDPYLITLIEVDEKPSPVLSLGFDLETGGHVFSLHMSNSRGMNERAFLVDTDGEWGNGDIYFGFNISRNFSW